MIVFEQRACTILYNIISSINNGKAYLLPSNICPIVVATFLKAGKTISFVDIANDTLCMDEAAVLSMINDDPSKYAGVLFVRSYGVTDNFENFFKAVKELDNTIVIIDDKCIAPPSFEDNLGYADVNLYSTGYSKFVDINGCAYAYIKDTVRYHHRHIPYTPGHLDALNANFREAINGTGKFDFQYINWNWLDTSTPSISFEQYKDRVTHAYEESYELKSEFNSRYSQQLPAAIQLDLKFQNWRFNIVVSHKEELLKHIFEANLFASTHFKPSTTIFYDQPSANADALSKNIVNLFSDKYFPLDKVDEVVSIVNYHVTKYS